MQQLANMNTKQKNSTPNQKTKLYTLSTDCH